MQLLQHLLLNHARQEEPFSLVNPDVRVLLLQPVFFRLGVLRKRRIKEVKRPANLFHYRFQAPRTHQFDLRLEVSFDTNLPFQQLRRGCHFHRLELLDLRRMKIDAPRTIRLPDAQLVDGQFLNVKEHLFSASGAYAHALPLLSRLPAKSRNRPARLHFFAPCSSGPLPSTRLYASCGTSPVIHSLATSVLSSAGHNIQS